MTSIQIILDGDGCWPDLADLPEGKLLAANISGVALLPDADVTDTLTGENKRVPALSLRIRLPDGMVGIAQMKLDMFETIAKALRSRMDYLAEQAAKGGAQA